MKGFVKENPTLFKNVSKEELEKASKKYNDYTGVFSPAILKIFTVPLLVAMYLTQVHVAPDANPILWGPGVYVGIMSILSAPVFWAKKRYNTSIFEARNRVMQDMEMSLKDKRFW